MRRGFNYNVVVGESEPCAWCGRPGARRECDAFDGPRIRYRDPVLCEVCVHLWDAPGAVHDAWYEHAVDYDRVVDAVEAAIEQWYRQRTNDGEPAP